MCSIHLYSNESRYSFFLSLTLQLQPTSLEMEVFPHMVEDNELHCIEVDGKTLRLLLFEDFMTRVYH